MATTEEVSAKAPDVAERYAGAVATANLTAPPEWRPTDAYILVASGLGRKGLGGELMRLQTEWSRTAKPHRVKPMTVGEYLEKLPLIKLGEEKGPDGRMRTIRGQDLEGAKRMAAEAQRAIPTWFDAEIRMLKHKLRGMPKVRDHLCIWVYGESFAKLKQELDAFPDRKAEHPQFAHAESLVAQTLLWWLDDTCTTCNGERWQVVPNTTRLSNRKCMACAGTGKKREPEGLSQQMLDYMRQCIYDWRNSTGDQLRTMSGRRLQAPKK
jgi:hypothetical protein